APFAIPCGSTPTASSSHTSQRLAAMASRRQVAGQLAVEEVGAVGVEGLGGAGGDGGDLVQAIFQGLQGAQGVRSGWEGAAVFFAPQGRRFGGNAQMGCVLDPAGRKLLHLAGAGVRAIGCEAPPITTAATAGRGTGHRATTVILTNG